MSSESGPPSGDLPLPSKETDALSALIKEARDVLAKTQAAANDASQAAQSANTSKVAVDAVVDKLTARVGGDLGPRERHQVCRYQGYPEWWNVGFIANFGCFLLILIVLGLLTARIVFKDHSGNESADPIVASKIQAITDRVNGLETEVNTLSSAVNNLSKQPPVIPIVDKSSYLLQKIHEIDTGLAVLKQEVADQKMLNHSEKVQPSDSSQRAVSLINVNSK